MPTVVPPAKVLVTGANGYIAIWVVRTFLEQGYSVRGTVRAESKTASLRNLFKDELQSGKLELVIVPDITQPGAFDEAVKGVDAVAHTASPFTFMLDDPEEFLGPAVKGTVGILESALEHGGRQLKRVVVLSSTAAISSLTEHGRFNEDSWNTTSIAEVKEKGRAASNVDKYCASKALAEKSAWEFVTKNASSLTWDLVTLCPPFVFGPVLNEVSSPAELGTSMAAFYQAVISKEETPEMFKAIQSSWIDVRDVASSHVKALEVPEAGGQRFIISAGEFTFQDILDVANEIGLKEIKKGSPGTRKDSGYRVTLDSSKAQRVFGLVYRDTRTMVKDTVEDLRSRGW